jgi:hypothetical protein
MLWCSRVRELHEALSVAANPHAISSRNARVEALEKRWNRLRAGLGLILDQRDADMADLSGGASGFPSKTGRARIEALWVSERSPQIGDTSNRISGIGGCAISSAEVRDANVSRTIRRSICPAEPLIALS